MEDILYNDRGIEERFSCSIIFSSSSSREYRSYHHDPHLAFSSHRHPLTLDTTSPSCPFHPVMPSFHISTTKILVSVPYWLKFTRSGGKRKMKHDGSCLTLSFDLTITRQREFHPSPTHSSPPFLSNPLRQKENTSYIPLLITPKAFAILTIVIKLQEWGSEWPETDSRIIVILISKWWSTWGTCLSENHGCITRSLMSRSLCQNTFFSPPSFHIDG